MEKGIVSMFERFVTTMIVIVLVLVVTGFVFHFASTHGFFPSFFQKVGTLTNLQAQAGA